MKMRKVIQNCYCHCEEVIRRGNPDTIQEEPYITIEGFMVLGLPPSFQSLAMTGRVTLPFVPVKTWRAVRVNCYCHCEDVLIRGNPVAIIPKNFIQHSSCIVPGLLSQSLWG